MATQPIKKKTDKTAEDAEMTLEDVARVAAQKFSEVVINYAKLGKANENGEPEIISLESEEAKPIMKTINHYMTQISKANFRIENTEDTLKQIERLAVDRFIAGDDLSKEDIEDKLFADIKYASGADYKSTIYGDKTGDWHKEPQPTEWLIEKYIPKYEITTLVGSGGEGKTLMAWQMAYSMAADETFILEMLDAQNSGNWLKYEPQPGENFIPMKLTAHKQKVLYISWEDEENTFLSRLKGNLRSKKGAEILEDRLRIWQAAEPIWQPREDGSKHTSTLGEPSKFCNAVDDYIEEHDIDFVIYDPLAAAYASDENQRALVRQFMSNRQAFARRTKTTILIISHPPKLNEAQRQDNTAKVSGSTDWANSSKSVISLERKETNASKQHRKSNAGEDAYKAPILEHIKSNLGALQDTVYLTKDGDLSWKAISQSDWNNENFRSQKDIAASKADIIRNEETPY